MEIKTVGVVGAGTMGNGIAHVFARCGFRVVLVEATDAALVRGLRAIGKNLDREVAKNKISQQEKEAAIDRIAGVVDRSALSECDFVVEAVFERYEVKQEIFRELDRICRPEVILATNTSSISITRIAANTRRPGQVIGMHFFNPVPLMKLVEVIRGLATSNETFAATKALAEKLEKTPPDLSPTAC